MDELSTIKDLLNKNRSGMNIREISDKLKINRNSVAKILDILAAKDEVEIKTYGRSKVYYLARQVPKSDLMKFSSNFIITLDHDHRVVQANDAFLHHINIPKNMVLHTQLTDIQTDLFTDPEIIPAADTAIMGTETYHETCIKTKTGDTYYAMIFIPTRFQDQSPGVILFLENITERKKIEYALRDSEEKYRRLVEYTSDILYSLNSQGIIMYIGPQVSRFGYNQEDFLSKSFYSCIHGEDREEVVQNFKKHSSSTGKITNVFRIADPQGRLIWFESRSMSQRDDTGAVIGTFGIMQDITERKNAEEDLRKSENRFRMIFENANDAILIIADSTEDELFEKRNTIIDGNLKACQLFGYDKKELQTITPPELLPELMRPQFNNVLQNIVVNDSFTTEIYLQRKDGSVFPAEGSCHLIEYEGRLVWICLVRDLTERKKADDILRESEERFHEIFNNANDAIVIHTHRIKESPDSPAKANSITIIDANKATCRMFGYSREELLTMTLTDFLPEEFRHQSDEMIRRSVKMVSASSELILRRKDRSMFPVEASSHLVEYGGKRIWLTHFRDLTERKKAEDALRVSEGWYREVFEGAAEGILIADIETKKFIHANPAICRMLGYSLQELTRMGVENIHPEEDLAHVINEFSAQACGKKAVSENIRCLRKDGTIVYADINASPAMIDGVMCNIGFFTDITERKRAEEALHEIRERFHLLHQHISSVSDPGQ